MDAPSHFVNDIEGPRRRAFDSVPSLLCEGGTAMAVVTINEGLLWLKTLRGRHTELVTLRNENSQSERRYYGANADKQVDKTPVYDIKELDKLITGLASEIRRVEMAIKQANAVTPLVGVEIDDAKLGQLV